jgi:hypothetical protein
MASETMPYESLPTRAAVKVFRVWGMRKNAAYEGRGAGADMLGFLEREAERGRLSAATTHPPVFVAGLGGPYAKRRNMRLNVTAGTGS